MDVQLYVYDLTRGMARNLSQSFLGIQIDAVYHTSLVFNGIEYFFGSGIQTSHPGSTHHGQPMETIPMGITHLPMDTIQEYLDSLEAIYSPESYDLFAHNCNNFTNDFSMFLVGKGIPSHITGLPKRVLDTPFGAMLKTQIDSSMRSITQAAGPPRRQSRPSQATDGHAMTRSRQDPASQAIVPTNSSAVYGTVINVTDKAALHTHLQTASDTAATIFFTSSTCAPCKMAYPMFDQLAAHHSNALFVKVDISQSSTLASIYEIRATPTFVTLSKGKRQDSWTGADPNLLKANVDILIERTFPPHPHAKLNLATLQYGSLKPVTYTKTPPLDKLMAKLGTTASETELVALRSFVEERNKDPRDATLPDLPSIGHAYQAKIPKLPVEIRFAAIDLLRCAMIDTRVGGFFAEEQENTHTIAAIVEHVNELESCPHNLRLVTLHLACNLFISPLYTKQLMELGNALAILLIQLITSSLLDASHPTTRVAAASLAFNMSATNYRIRRERGIEALSENEQVELAASLIETLSGEDNGDALKALLLALGYLFYYSRQDGELVDLAKALDAKRSVVACKGQEVLAKEVASLLQ